MNEDGTKLSKRQSDIHVEHYRSEGYYPEAIINFVTMSGGAFKDRDQVLEKNSSSLLALHFVQLLVNVQNTLKILSSTGVK
jgi:glutamyl/glutaminyl-tRNA synthetase